MPRPALRCVAAVCAVLVWVLGLLAASPGLHEMLHHDAHQEGHMCAVTLFSQGLDNPAPDIPLTVAPSLLVIAVMVLAEPRYIAAPHYRLPPGRGPPAC